MDIKENTLVLVLGQNDIPPKSCWGLTAQKFPSGNYSVLIEKIEVGKHTNGSPIFYPETAVVSRGQLVPIVETDGTIKDPLVALRRNIGEIFIRIFQDFLPKKDPKTNPIALKENTLVIVLSPAGRHTKTCWGIVEKQIEGGGIEVNIGRKPGSLIRRPKNFFAEKIIVPPEQLIPILNTDGATKNPSKALLHNIDNLTMEIILQHIIDEGGRALQRLLSARAGNLGLI